MSRYIDTEILGFINFKDRPDKSYADGIQTVMEFVDSLPSANVRKNVTGEWIPTLINKSGYDEVRCSKCGLLMYWCSKFCPNCGAYMRGEENG